MTAEPLPAASPSGELCPLCDTPVSVSDSRCPQCNMTLAGVGNRPAAFSRRSLWLWAGGLVVVYLVVLVILALAR